MFRPNSNIREPRSNHIDTLINTYLEQFQLIDRHIQQLTEMREQISENILLLINARLEIPSRFRSTADEDYIRASNHDIARLNFRASTLSELFNPRTTNTRFRPSTSLRSPSTLLNRTPNSSNIDLVTLLRTPMNELFQTPVTIRPTNAQIETASRLVRYGNLDDPISPICPISLERFNSDDQVRELLPCRHIFHETPLRQWFEQSTRCPVCRYDIRDYVPAERAGQEQEQELEESDEESVVSNPRNNNTTNTANTTNTTNTNNIDLIANVLSNALRGSFSTNQNSLPSFNYDPENGLLFFETIIRTNSRNNNDRNNNT